MKVALFARRPDKLDAIAERVRAAGGEAITVVGDVTQQLDNDRLMDETERAFGSVWAVFANAGFDREDPTHAIDWADLRSVFETNFFGSLMTARPAIERMLTKGGGHVVFCSSCLSKLGSPYHAAYSATKACQDHFARAMRIELRDKGVLVSSLHPIGTKTELFVKSEERSGPEGGKMVDARSDRFQQTPERVARAVVNRLRKRKGGEIWTSYFIRTALAFGTFWPDFCDGALDIGTKRRLKAAEQKAAQHAAHGG